MRQATCGGAIAPSVRNENGAGSSSPGCSSKRVPVDACAPSSRGGVPVLKRPMRQAEAVESRSASAIDGRLADAAAGRLLVADMDEAAQEGAGGQHDGAGARSRGRRPGRTPATRPPSDRRDRSTSPSITVRPGVAATSACIACAVELAVRLRARAPHGRALAAVEQPELDAARDRRRGPSAPPSASISRTRWPLPRPPIAGLQDISPMPSRRSVTRAPCARPSAPPQAPPPRRHGRRRSRRRRSHDVSRETLLLADAEAGENLVQQSSTSTRPTSASSARIADRNSSAAISATVQRHRPTSIRGRCP